MASTLSGRADVRADVKGDFFVARLLDDTLAVSPPPGAADGSALILLHRESADMSDLTQATLRGTLDNGVFVVRRRIGSLEGGGGDGGELARRKAASAARRRMAGWPLP